MKLGIRRAFFFLVWVMSQSAFGEIHIENPEWSLYDDFEGAEDKSFWSAGHYSYHGEACSSDPKARGNVLKFKYEKDNPEPKEGWSEKRFLLPFKARQIEMSYRLYVPGNYVHAPENHKNFVLWSGTYGSSKANMSVASESWPASGGAKPSLNVSIAGKNYGHSMMRNGQNMYSDRQGSWQQVHVYIELAESEGDIGLAEIHRNGILVVGTNDKNMEKGYYEAPEIDEQMKFSSRGNYLDRGYILGWVNGGFKETTIFCIDDFSIKASSSVNNVSKTSPPKKPASIVVINR